MRANTQALTQSPAASVIRGTDGREYLRLSYPSVRACQQAALQHARTSNESLWLSSPSWLGLGEQSVADFDATGCAKESLKAVQNAAAKMAQRPTKSSRPHAAITGGFWDVPSVLQGLPLAARARQRTKLPPRNIKLGISISADVDAAQMSALTVQLARAIWDYTLAGGAVRLSIGDFSKVRNSPYAGAMVECQVNCADVAALATVLSPAPQAIL
jgi:hypothetical protein